MVDDVPPQQKSSGMKWLIIGCAGCALVGVLIVGGLFAMGLLGAKAIMAATDPPKKDAYQFLAQAGAGDIDGAYAHFSPELAKVLDKPAFKEQVEQHPDLFKINEAASAFNNVAWNNGLWTIRGTLVDTKGKSHGAVFTYTGDAQHLKMMSFKIDED